MALAPDPHHALLVIDVQAGFDDLVWGRRDNPQCETNIQFLLDAWRESGRPVVVVRHDSTSPTSPLRPGQPGNDLRPGIEGDGADGGGLDIGLVYVDMEAGLGRDRLRDTLDHQPRPAVRRVDQ